ncbi:hypothetical protein AHiyo4_25480 [Arthrobacter sp. Hiyo4]|nr:hypothetical protein AHiyo4_25480 [Arthrobacter sp. Hiyo4]
MAGVGFFSPFNDEPGQVLAVEADSYPDAGLRGPVQFGRHAVVERPVQMRQRRLHEDPGHRKVHGQRGPDGLAFAGKPCSSDNWTAPGGTDSSEAMADRPTR